MKSSNVFPMTVAKMLWHRNHIGIKFIREDRKMKSPQSLYRGASWIGFPQLRHEDFLADFVRTGGYPEYLIRKVLIEPHLPRRTDWKLVEVGSAPGLRLVEMNRRLGYIPYGVEYSAPGVEINRQTFAANGLDPALVIHADFFSYEFQEKFHEYFDVVTSYGFIEHFSDAAVVVRKHVDLLKKGGRLLVVIPNLRSVRLLVTRFLSPEVVGQHNLRHYGSFRF